MNVLPLITLLLLLLSVLTAQQLQNFKNVQVVRKEHYDYLKEDEAWKLRSRQNRLYLKMSNSNASNSTVDDYYHTRRINFRLFLKKEASDIPEQKQALKTLTKDLIQGLYSQADFFKKLEEKRPTFLDEIFDYLIKESEAGKDLLVGGKEIEDLARVRLPDEELQEAFYHMLKGTVERIDKNHVKKYQAVSESHARKSYCSLLNFVQAKQNYGATHSAEILLCNSPKEILTAIYGSEEIADKIIEYRGANYRKNSKKNNQSTEELKEFIENQLHAEPKDERVKNILKFTMSTTDPKNYDK